MRLLTKFSAISIILVLTVIVGTSAFMFIFERRFLMNEVKKNEISMVNSFAEISKQAYVIEDDLLLLNFIQLNLMRSPAVSYALFEDSDGKIKAHNEASFLGTKEDSDIAGKARKADSICSQYYRDRDGYWIYDISQPVVLDQVKIGVVRLGFYEYILDNKIGSALSNTRARILGVGLVALSFGIVMALIMANMITKPIEKLSQGVRRIGEGELNLHIDVDTKDEIGELAGEFNRMAVKLKELDEMKDDFVSSVSHELRSPLTSIQGYVKLVNQGKAGAINDRQKEYLSIAQNNTARLARFINDILDMARIKAGKISLELKPIDIKIVVQEMVALFRPNTMEKNIVLKTEFSDLIPKVSGDEDKIKQVLTNLINNAIKFTPEGGTIKVGVKGIGGGLLQNSGTVEVYVEDTGVGIPSEQLNEIFEKFRQVKETKQMVEKVKGTGLGLAIVKGIVEAHGGKIWVESQLGVGSKFTFTLLTPVRGHTLNT